MKSVSYLIGAAILGVTLVALYYLQCVVLGGYCLERWVR